jgi:early secretory antigenic target protein ESAT-6
MNDMIKVTFGQLEATREQVSGTVTSVNGLLGDLHSYLQPMVTTWQGQAAENYQAKQRQWDQAANDLNEVLAAIGRALGSANEGFQSTESQNAARFA